MKRSRLDIARACIFAFSLWISMFLPLSGLGRQADSNALFLIHRNGLWGYSDRNGMVVIKPQFAMGGFFDHGTAEVWRNDNGQKHLIDARGNVIKDRNFASDHFSEGLIPVKIEDKYGYEDEHGKMVIFHRFEYAGDFSEGLAAVKIGDKWGYINPEGNFVIKPQFDDAKSFSEGLAVIRLYGTLLRKERALHTLSGYEEARDYGFINKAGVVQVLPAFDVAGDFSHGLAPVCNGVLKEKKCGYIDTNGKIAIELKFDQANSFSEGLASVKIGLKFGYIDTAGSVVIAPIFETALDFQGGLAFAAVGMTTFRWGRRGVTVVTGTFHGKQGYIDKSGRFASKPLSWDS